MQQLVRHGWRMAAVGVIVAIAFSVVLLVAAWGGQTAGPAGRPSDVPTAPGEDPRTDPIPVNPWAANDPALAP